MRLVIDLDNSLIYAPHRHVVGIYGITHAVYRVRGLGVDEGPFTSDEAESICGYAEDLELDAEQVIAYGQSLIAKRKP